ncbi:MAG: hypothetical protein M1604_00050 [Patescibacteria group bacterium]|nr:hypothetical protein [Patescibacteria group bacterium]
MKHEKKYYAILSLILIAAGAVVVGFGVWYGYQVFRGNDIPSILEAKINVAPGAATESGARFGATNSVELLAAVGQNAEKLGDALLQYLFVFLIFSGGGRMAKMGINTAMIPYRAKKEEEKEEKQKSE